MNGKSDLVTYMHPPAHGGAPKQLVILLHGLGADGQDLIGLAPLFAQILPDAMFVSPDAPYPCDMAPYGRQWFSLQSWDKQAILRGIQQANPILQGYIDAQLEKYNLKDENLALVGFSQGTMMSLYSGPRRPHKIAGILGYSGALMWEDYTTPTSIKTPPVHLVHGEADEIVPIVSYHQAKTALEKFAFTVTGMAIPNLAHGIDEGGIRSGGLFLKEVFDV